MYTLFVVGGHYGDEGKGKIVDILAARADVVARGSGGNNAGHTIVRNGRTFKFHLLPSGCLYPGTINVLGMGMLIDVHALVKELAALRDVGYNPKLRIASQAHIVMDWHRAFDAASEASLGAEKIGTTRKGIGPAAEAKHNRKEALRIADLKSDELFEKVSRIVFRIAPKLVSWHPDFSGFRDLPLTDIINPREALKFSLTQYAEEQAGRLREAAKVIMPFIDDDIAAATGSQHNKFVLGEGAQGTFLDTTVGSFPDVTSTPTTAPGLCIGLGIGPGKVNDVMGVFKAYETRVGSGRFETELTDEQALLGELGSGRMLMDSGSIASLRKGTASDNIIGKHMVVKGHEFGTTTGRVRRCGWFNLEEARRAVQYNGLTWIAITKLDVLDELHTIKVGIRTENEKMAYKTFSGWLSSTENLRNQEALPDKAKFFLNFLEQQLAPIAFVSVGPDAGQTIITKNFRNHLAKNGISI
ncbi:adenylosuccinate synthetase [Candidatus Woesearchaeota archaeon]|nr:adenylosuccinate synthetase [Candidatus Woesearchaeota archaeon]